MIAYSGIISATVFLLNYFAVTVMVAVFMIQIR